jgi:hypothetical protein
MKQNYDNMAVIFLDILGTKEMVAFKDKIIIHQLFHTEVKLNEKRQEQLSHVVYERKLYSFSDCAYIIYYYKDDIEETRKNDINLIRICLFNTSISILKIINAGFLVRGGVAFGECYFDDLGFFGSAIENAYLQESKNAKYPRIFLEEKIGKELYESERKNQSDEITAKIFTSKPYLILRDDDGYYLNIFYELERNTVLDFGEINLSLDDIKRKISEKINKDKLKYSEDKNILSKLEWMQNFANNAENKINNNVVSGATSIVLGDYNK